MRLGKGTCILRSAKKADCEQLAIWWNDGTIMAHAGFYEGIHTTKEEVWENIQKDLPNKVRLMMEYEEQPIGEMCFFEVDAQTVEIGIKICVQDKQNHGLGKVYLDMLISYLFTKYDTIVLSTMKENTRAQHVYEQLNFHFAGIEEGFVDSHGHKRIGYVYKRTK